MAGKTRKIAAVVCLTLCAGLLLCVPALAAPEPAFRLDMDNLNPVVGYSCYIVVTMDNAQGAEVISVQGLENFNVLSTNTGTSYSTSNGETVYQETLYYTVMPKTTGQFSLYATIEFNGGTYETNALEVTVGDNPANGGEDVSNLFVRTILSHDQSFLGEKVMLSYELYSRYSIDRLGFTETITIDGIVSRGLQSDRQDAEQVYIDGILYTKYTVSRLILDPIKSGEYTIPSFPLQVDVVTNNAPGMGRGGIMGNPFGFSEPQYLQTERVTLTVKPLPTEGKPADFSGIVGQLRLEGVFSREQMNYGDSLSLRVTAYGSCNLDGLKEVASGRVPGFSVYETVKDTEESIEDNRYHVQKVFEVILVPERNGELDIRPISLSYFDPETGTYESAEIAGTSIQVLGDMPQQNAGGQSYVGDTVRISQVSYTDADADEDTILIQLDRTVLDGILIGLGVVAVLLLALVLFLKNRKKRDLTLKALYKQVAATRDENEMFNLLCEMIKHRYGLSLKASTRSAIQSGLADSGVAAQVASIMDYMESAKPCGECGVADLKAKITGVYRLLAS